MVPALAQPAAEVSSDELLQRLQTLAGDRILLVTDDRGTIYVRRVFTVIQDGNTGDRVYRCKSHLGMGPTINEALVDAMHKVEAEIV